MSRKFTIRAPFDLPSGSTVAVIADMGRGCTITQTRSEPWELTSGRWLVSLVGRSGGYDLDRCFLEEPSE